MVIVALDEAGQVLMIRQYRHPVAHVLWELPAGLRDVRGEPLRATAERELLEETGYRARDWRILVDFYSSPGISTEWIRVFLARDLVEVPAAQRDFVPRHEETQLQIRWAGLDEALDAVPRGRPAQWFYRGGYLVRVCRSEQRLHRPAARGRG